MCVFLFFLFFFTIVSAETNVIRLIVLAGGCLYLAAVGEVGF